MRIGLDAALHGTRRTGIALYGDELASALEAEGCEVVRMGARGAGEVRRHTRSRSLWFAAELPLRLVSARVDLFHGVNNFQLPLWRTRVPYVVTVHDLIPQIAPETVSAKFRWQFRIWFRRTLSVADAIVCVSETTRRDLLRLHPVDGAKVHVVYNGIDHVPPAIDPEEAGRRVAHLGLPDRYFLCAGALDARKNVGSALAAAHKLAARRRDFALVVAGQDWFGSGAVRAQIERRIKGGAPVRVLGFLPDDLLHAVMARAVALLFPSRYEGFGLPPLEAMRLGTPAIVSNTGALPEVCAGGAMQVAPDDADGLAAAMERLLDDSDLRSRWSDLGRRRAEEFTWRRCAQQTLAVYRSILR